MPKKQPPTGTGDDNGGYEVGYGKPPKHSQFRPGRSGNPSGRRKGLRNLATDVKIALEAPIRITENGRSRRRSTQAVALMALCQRAVRGDARAVKLVMDLAGRFNNAGETAPTERPGADDRAILEDYWVAVADTHTAPPTTAASDADPKKKGKT